MLICQQCGENNKIIKKGIRNNTQRYKCTICNSYRISYYSDDDIDIVKHNVRLAKEKQKMQDLNRIERKSFRDVAKIENGFEEYIKTLCELLDKRKIPSIKKHKISKNPNTMIVQLSDTHFNELVDLGDNGNKYDFKIASKRLYKFAGRIITYIKAHGIKNVFLVMTGDIINSDRRSDEIMAMATNRGKATLLAFDLITNFIININEYANVNVISVSGNESRIREEYSNSNFFASDNFDFMIYEMLKRHFVNNKSIKFIDGNNQEFILGINGNNFLITHGNFLGKKMNSNDISKTIARYIQNKNIKIEYIICGHLHETKIKDSLMRSGSLIGANDYSDKGLNLSSRASQNIYLIYANGYVDSIRIDLQKVNDDDKMYDIDETLEEYNAKSISKVKKIENILMYQAIF